MVKPTDDVSVCAGAATCAVSGRPTSMRWVTQPCTTASATVLCCYCATMTFACTMSRECACLWKIDPNAMLGASTSTFPLVMVTESTTLSLTVTGLVATALLEMGMACTAGNESRPSVYPSTTAPYEPTIEFDAERHLLRALRGSSLSVAMRDARD